MQDDNYKEDLFGKGASSGKQPRLPVFDGYVKQQRYLPYLKMPTEYAVIAIIGVLVLLTLSYAWGVKVGRSWVPPVPVVPIESIMSEANEIEEEEEQVSSKEYQETREMRLKSYLDYTDTEEASEASEEELVEVLPEIKDPETEKIEVPVAVPAPITSGGYVIYLAAFKEENRAQELADKLKKTGTDARFSKKSDWYQVYAAGFKTIAEANSAKALLKKSYADCYIRKVE